MQQLCSLVFLLLLTTTVFADSWRPEVKVYARDGGDHVDVWCENLSFMSVTADIDITRLDNAQVTPASALTQENRVTVVLEPKSKRCLLKIEQRDHSQPWHYHFDHHVAWGRCTSVHDSQAVYQLPYRKGVVHRVDQGFAGRFSHQEEQVRYSVDLDLAEGEDILCAREGTVVLIEERFREGGVDKKYATKSNFVVVEHPDGTLGEYFHLQAYSAAVMCGQKVKPGDRLGRAGHTGYATKPHLHFMVTTAIDGHHRKSVPFQFLIGGRPKTPVEGESYTP